MSSPAAFAELAGASAADPWAWRPSRLPWFKQLERVAALWEPSCELGLDQTRLVETLMDAARRRERWLLHPCINPLTIVSDELRLQRDFQLAVWVAAHTTRPLGPVTLPESCWAWSPDGGAAVPPGVHDLTILGNGVARHSWPFPIAVDMWGRSIGPPAEQSWAVIGPSDAAETEKLQREVTCILRATAVAGRKLTALFDWVTAMTQVVVPLRRMGGVGHSHSSSNRQLPGAVFLTIRDEIQVLEALVHETAHNYLFLAETRGTLVNPAHTSTYASPLRPDPRPLLGILLAYHALAYICAFYADALQCDLARAPRCEEELAAARAKLQEAERVLLDNRCFLTESGDEFLEHTLNVARYSHA